MLPNPQGTRHNNRVDFRLKYANAITQMLKANSQNNMEHSCPPQVAHDFLKDRQLRIGMVRHIRHREIIYGKSIGKADNGNVNSPNT